MQTPQVFRRAALERALSRPDDGARARDRRRDARRGRTAAGCASSRRRPENLKVTTPVDLRLAELLLAERARQPS